MISSAATNIKNSHFVTIIIVGMMIYLMMTVNNRSDLAVPTNLGVDSVMF